MIIRRPKSGREVIERTAVPVTDVIDSLIRKRNINTTQQQFPITEDEIWGCVDYVLDAKNPGKNEKIDFTISYDEDGELCVNTESMTDWIYLTSLTYGRMFKPNLKDLNFLYSVGLENVMREILEDLQAGNTDFSSSALHDIVHRSFIQSYGELTPQDVRLLLSSLKGEESDYT